MKKIATLPLGDGNTLLSIQEHADAAAWCVTGDPTAGLHALALALRELGLAHVWRDEQLAINDLSGRRIATVERAVVRVLGIATHAVHLVGRTGNGHHWVQQRSLTKANDPGLWDTLMGGMVGAADTLDSALERETWEEAGLHLSQLKDLVRGGQLEIRRPCEDGGGTGYVIECIDWYHCTVPDGLEPLNQDGEVERFVLTSETEMLERMHNNEFTREAALIQADLMTAHFGLSSRT